MLIMTAGIFLPPPCILVEHTCICRSYAWHRCYYVSFGLLERQKQGHKDSTSEIYWDSWDAGRSNRNTSPARLSHTSQSDDDIVPLSSPSSDADTDVSRLSAFSASDTPDAVPSPRHSPRPLPVLIPSRSSSSLKRSASDEANLGTWCPFFF